MTKLFKFLIIIPLIIFGCKNKEIEKKYFIQSINTLNMKIFSKEGKKILSIESPNSIYDKESNSFNLKETTINLFNDNKLEYIIYSDTSELSNNNKLIKLNGNVLIKTINQQDDKLTANSFTWNINNSEYILVGNVIFENNTINLSSNRAVLNNDANIIEFFKPVKYKIKDSNNEDRYEINSENAFYNINTKSVIFSSSEGKVRSKLYF